jgi:hypothetical protein
MRKDNKLSNSPLYQKIVKTIKKAIRLFRQNSIAFSQTHQQIQLSVIYLCATGVLAHTIRNTLGFFPEVLYQVFPFVDWIFDQEILFLLSEPDKTFIIYLLIMELIISRPVLKFSLLVKFNLLLIFILEMLMNLFCSWWDILFIREIDSNMGTTIIDRYGLLLFYTLIFFSFFSAYMYSYYRSMRNRFPIFPGFLRGITDSVAFWLRIKIVKNKRKK